MFPSQSKCKVAIIGVGYVGLPLAITINQTKKCCRTNVSLDRKVLAYDINKKRIDQLKKGIDLTGEIENKNLIKTKQIKFTSDENDLIKSNIFIITVPTPLKDGNTPDFEPLKKACKSIGQILKERKNFLQDKYMNSSPIIIFESTVYPGATEEICIPIIEKYACQKLNNKKGFYCGYSPERINPGDKNYRLKDIVKVTSGSNKKASDWIDKFYGSIINAGTFKAKSIKIAEAAKVIENTQRDLNIALINELSIIFDKLKIDTLDVLEASKTKWNFYPFYPGLVGGHCIGVDPYYLTYKSIMEGYDPKVILAGRKINDSMSSFVAKRFMKEFHNKFLNDLSKEILILGISFKENCPDLRNSKNVDFINLLKENNHKITIVDPIINTEEAYDRYNLRVLKNIPNKKYDAIILLVAHKEFIKSKSKWEQYLNKESFLFDLKGVFPRSLKPIRI